MTTAPPSLVPDRGAETEALIREARRRQRRRYLLTGLVAVLLAGAAGVTASQIGPGGRPRAHQRLSQAGAPRGKSVPSPGQATVPRFFADVVTTAEANGPLEVRSSATGALVARQVTRIAASVSALAATGPRSFVLAEPAIAPRCGTRLYRVRLTGRGHLGRLVPVGAELPGWVSSLAAGAGGRVIGYAVSGCGKGRPGYIGVLDTRTGRSREWGEVNVGGNPGNVALSGALSMSASGHLLAFTGWDLTGNWHVLGEGHFTRQVVRVLPTSAAAGTVAQRSHVVLSGTLSLPALTAVALSPDARSFYLCTRTSFGHRSAREIAAYATATGRRQRVITTLTGTFPSSSCQMALDPTGRSLLLTESVSNPQGYPGTPVLRLARIDLTTGATAVLGVKLPRGAGMDPYTGMSTAW
jgi:hypothetical protein